MVISQTWGDELGKEKNVSLRQMHEYLCLILTETRKDYQQDGDESIEKQKLNLQRRDEIRKKECGIQRQTRINLKQKNTSFSRMAEDKEGT